MIYKEMQREVVIKMAEGPAISHKGLMRVRSPIIQTFAYLIQISHMQTSNDTDMESKSKSIICILTAKPELVCAAANLKARHTC